MRRDLESNIALVEQLLLAELNEAREAYEHSPDEVHYTAYSAAIQRFSDFILKGTLPNGSAERDSQAY